MQPLGEIQKFPLRPVRWQKSLLQLIHFITILPHTVTIHLRSCHMLYMSFFVVSVVGGVALLNDIHMHQILCGTYCCTF